MPAAIGEGPSDNYAFSSDEFLLFLNLPEYIFFG
jgi:hypothetical protein